MPLGNPVVPDVYNRLGSGVMSSDSSVVGAAASHVAPVGDPVDPVAIPTDDRVDSCLAGRSEASFGGLGPDEQDACLGVAEDVGGLVGGEVEVDRHRRCAGQQPAEVSECGFDSVLGEHGDATRRTEVRGIETIGDTVEHIIDFGPVHCLAVIAYGDLLWAFYGELAGEHWHVPDVNECGVCNPDRMRFAFSTSPQRTTWPWMLEVWKRCRRSRLLRVRMDLRPPVPLDG